MTKKPTKKDYQLAAEILTAKRGVPPLDALEFARLHLHEGGPIAVEAIVSVWDAYRHKMM